VDVSTRIPSPEPRLTADEYLGAAPDAFGDIEVVDGLVVHNMARSEVHDLVVRRLAAALENARPASGPCFRVSSDVAVRFADAASSRADHRLNIRYPDIMVRDCDPYDVNTVRDRIRLLVEVTSEATFEADTTAKRVLYAAAGIPGYLVVHFDKDWARISEIEEYRLDWSKTVCGPGRTPPRAHPGRAVPFDRDVRRPPAALNPAGFPVQVLGHIIYVSDLHLLVFRLRPTRETAGHRGTGSSLSRTRTSLRMAQCRRADG
jgi:Uma2 family endonuclease